MLKEPRLHERRYAPSAAAFAAARRCARLRELTAYARKMRAG